MPDLIAKPSAVERIAGSLPAQAGAAVVSAIAAPALAPLAALLPVFVGSLAAGRQQERVQRALHSLNLELEQHAEWLGDLTDAQFHLASQAVTSIFETVDEEKLAYLRAVTMNAVRERDVQPHQATVLARWVRDLSPSEASFLLAHAEQERFQLASRQDPLDGDVLVVHPESPDGQIVTGLVSLGILIAGEPTWDDGERLRYTSLVPQLIRLLGATGTS